MKPLTVPKFARHYKCISCVGSIPHYRYKPFGASSKKSCTVCASKLLGQNSRMCIRELGWPPWVDRRRTHRLTLLYQIQRGLVNINPGSLLRINDKCTRGGHRIYQPAAPQQGYKYWFYPRTIQEWNRLPPTITDSPTREEFTAAIQAIGAGVFVAP